MWPAPLKSSLIALVKVPLSGLRLRRVQGSLRSRSLSGRCMLASDGESAEVVLAVIFPAFCGGAALILPPRGDEPMKAVLFEKFQETPRLVTVPDPTPEPHGVVLKVEATGVCRSDWYGWMGHDSDI